MIHYRERRFGITLVETVIASAMLAVLLSLAGQALVQLRRHARAMDDRAATLAAVENALEELAAQPWDAIDDDAIAGLRPSPSLSSRWPRAEFQGSVTTTDDPAPAKRVTLTFSTGAAAPGRPITLTTWVYRAEEAP